MKVHIPATSANMGVGFDAAGLALGIYNTIVFERRPSGLEIEAVHPKFRAPRDERNLIYRAAKFAADALGAALPGLYLRQDDHIPHTRGLGSSAACIVGGIMLADQLLEAHLTQDQILALATQMEGHPDNAAPAIFGGVCVSVRCADGGICTQHIPVRDDLGVVALVPDFTLSTRRAREVLPETVSRADAVANTSRMGLLVSLLYTGKYDLLQEALADRLHQPYRKALIPQYDAVASAAQKAGAYGVCLSGAGPTMLVFYPAQDAAFAERLSRALSGIEGGWQPVFTHIDQRGAYIEF